MKAEEKEQGEGAILVIAPDGTLVSASSYKELAEKARAYRDYLR
jgi:hypothetical protein